MCLEKDAVLVKDSSKMSSEKYAASKSSYFSLKPAAFDSFFLN